MHPKIEQQKQLMKSALKKLDEIETTKRLFRTVDPKFCKKYTDEYQQEYADTMALLVANLASIKIKSTTISLP